MLISAHLRLIFASFSRGMLPQKPRQIGKMGSSPVAQWAVVLLMLAINSWIARKLWMRLRGQQHRSNRREGTFRLFAAVIFMMQVYGLLLILSGLTGQQHVGNFEGAGFAFGGVPILYGSGLLTAWIVDGFTGRARRKLTDAG
jgi:hypothetical protein